VLAALDLKGPAVAFALRLDAIPFPKARTTTRPPLVVSDLQPVERDFAFVLDTRVEAEAVLKAARAADKALIAEATVFDVFEGSKAEAQMGAGRKSLAITVRLQPTRATLTEAEIEAVSARIVAGVTKATGGTLRT
jgi:phenylalanyl-tRNA synthetase beta chain